MLREEDIDLIVSQFYEIALNDVLIGYQFQKIEDFSSHVKKIANFWKNLLYPELYPVVFDIRFRVKHLILKLHIGELGRWIVLFYQTLDQWSEQNNQTAEIEHWKEKVELLKQMLLSDSDMFRTGSH